MKRRTALFGAAICFVVVFSLHLLTEVPAPSSEVPWDNSKLFEQINEIESQVAIHGELVKELRSALSELGALSPVDGAGPRGKLGPAVAQKYTAIGVAHVDGGAGAGRVAVVPEGSLEHVGAAHNVQGAMCSLLDKPVESADVKVNSVYDLLPFDNPDGGVWKQGFDITFTESQWTSADPLRVIVVPHSHDDPGWIKTFERYYAEQTRAIHTNMVPKLEEDPRRKFIYAEMSFFSLWWNEQPDGVRQRVKRLLSNGQLEIVTGGWVMTDEANSHYYAIVDQLIEGHEWMRNNIGDSVKPRSGWAIDPFGHSPTMAYILKRAGINNMLIQRVHYAMKKHLSKSKQLEFMWRQSWDSTGETDIFCHLMPFYSYDVPHTCGPEPAVCCQFDFKRLPGSRVTCPWKVAPEAITSSNVHVRAAMLLDQYRKKAQLFHSGTAVIAPLGDDFRYDEISEWDAQYGNYQKLFDYMNTKKEWHVTAKFGTLTDYFSAVRGVSTNAVDVMKPGAATVSGYPVLSGDFFTYADRDEHYWSGYYTSRPFYKSLGRMLEAHLRGAEILFSLAHGASIGKKSGAQSFAADSQMAHLVAARRNVALFQHHDGITGTSREHVVVDWGVRMLEAWKHTKQVMDAAAAYLLSGENAYDKDALVFDMDESRTSQDSLPEKNVLDIGSHPRYVVFYNSLAYRRQELVRLRVSGSAHISVMDSAGTTVLCQISPHFLSKDSISDTIFVVDFVVDIPALGLSTYTVRKSSVEVTSTHFASVTLYNYRAAPSSSVFKVEQKRDDQFDIGNVFLEARFSAATGMLQSITDRGSGRTISTALEFVKYGVKDQKERSGAYIFLPDGEAQSLTENEPLVRVVRGPLLQEVHAFYKNVEHHVRLPRSVTGCKSQALEIVNTVDITQEVNFEIAMRVKTGVDNADQAFYTDLNGFQMQRRRTLSKLPLQANFYPMPVAAYVEDQSTRVSLLAAESHGVASLKKGWLEAILDRRLMQDDGRGLNEPTKDNKRTDNVFLLVVEVRGEVGAVSAALTGFPSPLASTLSQHMQHRPFIMPVSSAASLLVKSTFSGLVHELSCDMHLMNLRTQQDGGSGSGPEQFAARRSAYLLVNRLAFDCTWPARALPCISAGDSLRVPEVTSMSSLFSSLTVSEATAVSLTGMYDLGPVTSVEVQPMHINAYRIAY